LSGSDLIAQAVKKYHDIGMSESSNTQTDLEEKLLELYRERCELDIRMQEAEGVDHIEMQLRMCCLERQEEQLKQQLSDVLPNSTEAGYHVRFEDLLSFGAQPG
jgi:hypothetical protein